MSLLAAFGLGAVTGVRSMIGLAFFSDRAEGTSKKQAKDNPALALLRMPQAAPIIKVMAAGEVVMDKMPFMPARTDLVPLMGRAALGALVGAAISKDKWIQGGVVGALGAVISAYAAYHIRKTLHDDRHIPNVVLGMVEDAVVLKAADAIVQQYEMS